MAGDTTTCPTPHYYYYSPKEQKESRKKVGERGTPSILTLREGERADLLQALFYFSPGSSTKEGREGRRERYPF